ncbi:MAG: nitrate reductase associated protein, partial [Ferruginibacter sp.]
INPAPLWANVENVPEGLQQKAAEFNWFITVKKWGGLTNLQRFALLKLFSPRHENKNFPKAMKEFGLATDTIE